METALRDSASIPLRSRCGARPAEVLAYVELHIEQGPILEARGLPVGCVTSISGATRFEVEIAGKAGHAGTVPMKTRHDALAAAAEMRAGDRGALRPGRRAGRYGRPTGNAARRHQRDPGRCALHHRYPRARRQPAGRCADEIAATIEDIAKRRGVAATLRKIHDMAAAPCAPWLMAQVDRAIAAQDVTPYRLPSGAGHDGMAMIALTDIGMIFVRCLGGISHNPAEAIAEADAEIGAQVLFEVLQRFQPSNATRQ